MIVPINIAAYKYQLTNKCQVDTKLTYKHRYYYHESFSKPLHKKRQN